MHPIRLLVLFQAFILASSGLVQAEETNLVVNGGMETVNVQTKLPESWTVITFPGLETLYEVRVTSAVSHGGTNALELTWKSGTPKFGVAAAVSGAAKVDAVFEAAAFVKTDAGGAACLGVVGYDKDGKEAMAMATSPAVEGRTNWVELKWSYSPEKGVAAVKLYCLNTGKGTAWFDDVRVRETGVAAKDKSELPLKVSATPVSGNFFWQNNKLIFNSISDSPCGLSFVFFGKKEEFKTPRFILEAPKDVKIAEVDFVASPYWRRSADLSEALTPEITETNRQGVLYRRYTLAIPSNKWDGSVLELSDSKPKLEFYFETTAGAPGNYPVYWFLENNGVRSPPQHFILRFLPPLAKTANPRVFKGGIYCSHDLNINNQDLLDKVLSKYEEAGIMTKYIPRDNTDQVNHRMSEHGWACGGTIHSLHENLPRSWGPPKELEGSIRWAVHADGMTPTNSGATACPNFALSNAAFKAWVDQMVQKQLEGMINGEPICFDYEAWGVPKEKCFCNVCLSEFSKRYNIPREKLTTPQEIIKNYRKEWGRFWCQMVYQMHAEAVAGIKKTHPASRRLIYDYLFNFDDPDIEAKSLFGCPLDTRLLDHLFDGHYLSTAGMYRNDLLEVLDRMSKVIGKGHLLVNPRISRYVGVGGGYTSKDAAHSPATFRLQLIGSAACGARDWLIYPGTFIDGMYFVEINRAMYEISRVEGFYLDGERSEKMVKVTHNGKHIKETKSDIGLRAHRLGNQLLVTLFNYDATKPATLTIQPEVGDVPYAVWDPVGKKCLRSPRAKSFWAFGTKAWSKSELQQGITIQVPAQDVRFLVIGPKAEIPSGLKFVCLKSGIEDKPGTEASNSVFHTVSEGKNRITEGQDLTNDGEAEILIENTDHMVWISPAEGGRVVRWMDKHNPRPTCVFCERDSRKGIAADLFWDARWSPEEQRWKGESERYQVTKTALDAGRPALTLVAESYGIQIEKTYLMTDKGLEVRYAVKNTLTEPQTYAFWSRHCPTLGLTNDFSAQSMIVARGPSGLVITAPAGADEASEDVYLVTGGGSTGMKGATTRGEINSGIIAFYVPGEKRALQATVDLEKLSQVYTYGGPSIRTWEWMYRDVVLGPGECWTTTIKMNIIQPVEKPEDALRAPAL